MTVLFDTNVILDLLLAREPHDQAAGWLVDKVVRGHVRGLLGATTVTTIHYLAGRHLGKKETAARIEQLIGRFRIATVDEAILLRALHGDVEDFEDTVLYESGLAAGADAVVTRDRRGFAKAAIPIYSPVALVAALRTLSG